MAKQSLTDSTRLIEEQVSVQEKLSECLCKAEAMACITSAQDFLDFKPYIIHAYFWVLCDIIDEAKTVNQQALSSLLRWSREL